MTRLVCNMMRCNHCMNVLISHHAHDYKECSCGKVFIDGGTDYLRRGYSAIEDYTEMSLYSDNPFELLRHFIFRGSRGKDGKSPLKWIKLSLIDDDYLDNLIKYKQDRGETDMWYDYYVQEKKFREED